MTDHDPFSRLKFCCMICSCSTLLMVTKEDEKTVIHDLFPNLEDENDLQLLYEKVEFVYKETDHFCCAGCGFVLNNNYSPVQDNRELLQWLKIHRMIDL